MEEIEGYTFGHVYKKIIDPKDADKFSKVFGEGSPALTELIKFCILNNIKTIASCKGHSERVNVVEKIIERGYISFLIEDDMEFAYFLASLPHQIKGIDARLEFLIEQGKSLTIEIPAWKKDMSEPYFEEILAKLKEFMLKREKGEEFEGNKDIKKIVDYVYSYPSLDYFLINNTKYKKYERKRDYLKRIATCPREKENYLLHRMVNSMLVKGDRIDEFVKK